MQLCVIFVKLCVTSTNYTEFHKDHTELHRDFPKKHATNQAKEIQFLALGNGHPAIYLKRKNTPIAVMKAVIGINAIIFGICFIVMAILTFYLLRY